MGKQYTVFDGKMMLVLEEAEEGGFVVTSPLDPGLVTQAETLQDAFRMAHDAAECLAIGRRRLAERLGMSGVGTEVASNPSETTKSSRSPNSQTGKKSRRSLNR